MELWIRSQDKDILVKVDSLLIDDNNNDIYTQCWVGVNLETYTLGKYRTKERALQVLDEIQNILQPKPLVIVRPSEEMVELLGDRQVGKTMKMKQDFEFKELSAYVYEMPEE